MPGFITLEGNRQESAYLPLGGFTTVDLGCERGNYSFNFINQLDAPVATQYIKTFHELWNSQDKLQDVTDVVIDHISTAYNENSPEFIYYITLMTSTGDDDLINPEEKGDLEYRRQQLKRLQDEVVDLEDMGSGISILDLGLNEFRLDLLEYTKTHGDLSNKPKGLHAVVPATPELPQGVIFVLRNVNDGVNIDNQNRIHPFYMVYVDMDGSVVCDYLNPKRLLDDIRLQCRGRSKPIRELCQIFNRETDDGRDMEEFSLLLNDAISSIIDTKEESDLDSLFRRGGTTALLSTMSGIEDFELISFLVVK